MLKIRLVKLLICMIFMISPIHAYASDSVYGASILIWDGETESDEPLTRAELSRFFVKTFNLEYEGAYPSFQDVTLANEYYADISIMAGLGLVGAYADGNFRPDHKVTRAEFAALLFRVLGYTEQDFAEVEIADVGDYHWASSIIKTLVSNEDMYLYRDRTFRPEQIMTKTMAVNPSSVLLEDQDVAAYKMFVDGLEIIADIPIQGEFNGELLGPLRTLAEALNIEITWNSETREIIFSKNQITISMAVGSRTAYVNDSPVELAYYPLIINGRTMVPYRFIINTFNVEQRVEFFVSEESDLPDPVPPPEPPEGLNIVQVKMYLDGQEIVLDTNQWGEYEGELLGPLRAISETIDAEVRWHADTAEIEINKDETTLVMTVGNNQAYFNGQLLELPIGPVIMNGRTMVPFEFIVELLGYEDRVEIVIVDESEDGSIDECFIATAAFGSKIAPAVALLRQFRDVRLLTNKPGQAFVRSYYTYSPALADAISGNEMLKTAVKILLLPVIALAWMLMNVEVILIILILAFVGVYIKRSKRQKLA